MGSVGEVQGEPETMTDTASRPAGAGPRARTYLRISQEDEKEILENQRRETYREARSLDLGEPVVYEEVESGGSDNRSQWNRLLADVRRGDVVVFTRPSRMTRGGTLTAFSLLARLEAMGVGWRFTEYGILNFDATTPKMVRDIVLAVISAIDEDYRRQISVATKAAHARKKALAEARGEKVRWGRPPKKRVPPLTTEAK